MDYFLDTQTLDIFLKLMLSAFLGALVGFERRMARKTAGMRTFALVALGSTLFTILSRYAALEFVNDASLAPTLRFDPARISAQIVVGVGFIGAGLIILRRDRVVGLTTAAGLWVVAALGMAIGYGLIKIAVFATILTLFIFLVLWIIEHNFLKRGTLMIHGAQDDNSDLED